VTVTTLTLPVGQGGNPAPNAPATFNGGQPLTLQPGRDEATVTLDLSGK